MKLVYQIGSIPLINALVNEVSLDESRAWVVKRTDFQQIGGQYTHTPLGRSIPDAVKVTIEGTLTSDDYQKFLYTSSRLRSVGGRKTIPLVVCEVLGEMNNSSIRWLYTNGSITDVKETSVYGEVIDGYFLRNISIEMSVDYMWRPLLSRYWEDRSDLNFAAFPTSQAGADNLFVHPTELVDVIARKGYYFQQWPNTLSGYTPASWPNLYSGEGYGSDYADGRSFYVLSHEKLWPASPSSIWAFTRLLPTGTISLMVNSEESTLSLIDLDSDLAERGYVGLAATDEVFAGDTQPFSSFVRRNGTVLPNLVPRWSVPGAYPGELFSGLNKVTVKGTNTSLQFASNIEFRTL